MVPYLIETEALFWPLDTHLSTGVHVVPNHSVKYPQIRQIFKKRERKLITEISDCCLKNIPSRQWPFLQSPKLRPLLFSVNVNSSHSERDLLGRWHNRLPCIYLLNSIISWLFIVKHFWMALHWIVFNSSTSNDRQFSWREFRHLF